jgi:hypothetical protein
MTTGRVAILNDAFDIRKNGDAAKDARGDVNLVPSSASVGRQPSANFDGRPSPNQYTAGPRRWVGNTSAQWARHIGITREQEARKP